MSARSESDIMRHWASGPPIVGVTAPLCTPLLVGGRYHTIRVITIRARTKNLKLLTYIMNAKAVIGKFLGIKLADLQKSNKKKEC